MFIKRIKNSVSKDYIFSKLHNWAIEHWIYRTLISTSPALYFTLVQILGEQLKLVNIDGHLKTMPLVLFWIFVVISVFYNAIISYSESDISLKKLNRHNLISGLLSGINQSCLRKLNTIMDYLKTNPKKDFDSSIPNILQPNEQIDKIVDELNLFLSKILKMEREEVGISIMYKLDGDKTWKWLCFRNISSPPKAKKLVDDPESAAHQIANEKTNYVFYHDKKSALDNKIYKKGKKDKDNNAKGSIICRDISLEDEENKYISSILSITTYQKQICKEEDEHFVKDELNTFLLHFENRLKIELGLFYIKSNLN